MKQDSTLDFYNPSVTRKVMFESRSSFQLLVHEHKIRQRRRKLHFWNLRNTNVNLRIKNSLNFYDLSDVGSLFL